MSHLRVLPPPGTPDPARRRGRSGALSLTADEARHLRASIRNIARVRYGTLAALADAMKVHRTVLTRRRNQGPGLAVAVWRLTGIPVETLLTGGLAVVPATLGPATEPPCAG